MENEGLYQKYRPSSFDGFVGNDDVVDALSSFFSKSGIMLPHALLLSGPYGCGKTTLARILAFMLGCDRTYGIVEHNAANTRGIDTVRELVAEAQSRPLAGRCRVYILDESHQLTSTAQEALLKVIEDHPKHSYFIFCTTEPQNIIGGIKSRCTQFEVSLLNRKQIRSLLDKVCDKEGWKFEEDVLVAICRCCNGSPRSALVLLEKISKIPDLNVQLAILYKGTEFDNTVWDLCKILGAAPDVRKKKWKEAFELLESLEEDSERIRRAILYSLSTRITAFENWRDAADVGYLLQVFSTRSIVAGKGDLFGMVSKACFGDLDF